MPTLRTMVVADMWSVTNFGDANKRFADFLSKRRDAAKRFVESLVIQDKVFIPTDDFMSLAIALNLFGERTVLALIEQGALAFVRLRGGMVYVGGGGGLKSAKVKSKEGPLRPFSAPMDEAIDWALSGLPGTYSNKAITKAVMDATAELAASVIVDDIRRETIADIAASPVLRKTFNLSSNDIDALPGIGPTQVRIFGGEDPGKAPDQIAALLRIAHANLELRAAEEVGADDLSTACPIGHVLKAKEDRVHEGGPANEAWVTLRQISDLPDIAEAILQEPSNMLKLQKLRQSKHGAEFRSWFHENCRTDPVVTGREYARLLKHEGLAEGPIARVARFMATTAAGMAFGDPTGVAAGAADSFVVDRLLRRPSAKIFIERLEQFEPLHSAE